MNNYNKLIELIVTYILLTEKIQSVIKYLYENTELFEKRYEHEFNMDLYDYFSGKITRCSKDINILYKLLNEKQLSDVTYKKLIMR